MLLTLTGFIVAFIVARQLYTYLYDRAIIERYCKKVVELEQQLEEKGGKE